MTRVEILATGPELIKKGIRGIEPVMEEIIIQASKEIQIMAYVFTSNALHILDLIEQAAKKGIRISIVVNELQSQDKTIISRFKKMTEDFPYVQIFDFTDPKKKQLHAKIIVVDRKKAVVGSANFSWGGMYSNYEVGLLIEGPPAWKLAEIVDHLSAKCPIVM